LHFFTRVHPTSFEVVLAAPCTAGPDQSLGLVIAKVRQTVLRCFADIFRLLIVPAHYQIRPADETAQTPFGRSHAG
jgi:hypothetical protein